MLYKVAVASSEGTAVDLCFDQADAFAIFSVDSEAGKTAFVEWRQTAESCGCEAVYNEESLLVAAGRLRDCEYVLVAEIGEWAGAALATHGLRVGEATGEIGPALVKLNRYYNL